VPLALDRQDAALLVVECQNDLIHASRAEVRGVSGALARAVADRGVIPRFRSLIETARTAAVPVLYATIENRPGLAKPGCPIYRWSAGKEILRPGTWGAEVHADLAPAPGDFVLRRNLSVDPSYGSALWPTLRALGRRTLVVGGVSTNFAVEGTVRAAVNRLFRVVLVEDCCASAGDDLHRFAVEKILPLLADVVSAEEVLSALRLPPLGGDRP
jgi:nicotinamidase-related amidase